MKTYDSRKTGIVDMETGELIPVEGTITELQTGDSVRSAEQNKHTSIRYKDFVIVNAKAVKRLSEIFRDNHTPLMVAMMLPPYVGYDSMIQIHGKPATVTALAEALGMGRQTVSDAMQELMRYGVLMQTRTGHISGEIDKGRIAWYVNPYIYIKGRGVLKTLKNAFDGTEWQCL